MELTHLTLYFLLENKENLFQIRRKMNVIGIEGKEIMKLQKGKMTTFVPFVRL